MRGSLSSYRPHVVALTPPALPPLSSRLPTTARALLCGGALTQLVLVLVVANGPSGDEGIYAWLGMMNRAEWPRVQGGDWVNGSPVLWPLLAGFLWRLGGLTAVRLATVAVMTLAVWLTARATAIWSGPGAATMATLLLLTSGPLLALGHLAVYDVPAIAWLALTLWAIARRTHGGGAGFIALAGGALGMAVVTKYALVFVVAPVALALGVRAWRDAVVGLAVCGVLVVGHNLVVLGHVVPPSYWAFEAAAQPVGRGLVIAEQLFFALPLALLAHALRRGAWHRHPRAVWYLAGGLLVFPLFHVVTGNPQSANKHVVIALVAAAPALGAAWAGALSRRWGIALGALGVLQWAVLEYSWVDARGAARRLADGVRVDDIVLANAGTFRYRAPLYARGVDAGLQELDVRAPRSPVRRTWAVLESPLTADEQTWLRKANPARAAEARRWVGWHIGADARRPFGLHHVETRLYRWEPTATRDQRGTTY